MLLTQKANLRKTAWDSQKKGNKNDIFHLILSTIKFPGNS